jgi:3-methyladenine DNA glycosylase AlkD
MKTSTLPAVRAHARRLATPAKAAQQATYVKKAPGEYGENEQFLGLYVPDCRAIVREHAELSIQDAVALARSRLHDERQLGLMFLVRRFERGNHEDRERVFRQWVRLFPFLNSWDFVDATASRIGGAWLDGRGLGLMEQWARSRNLWVRRVAVVATHHFVRRGEVRPSLRICALLARDAEDLVQKAVGWTLREVGKKDLSAEVRFLGKHAHRMPRTMLRYAVERMPEEDRKRWLSSGR